MPVPDPAARSHPAVHLQRRRVPPRTARQLRCADRAAWRLFWRDDGSSDGTVDIVRRLRPAGRPLRAGWTTGRIWASTASYMALLRPRCDGRARPVAFADQDDVWLPEKLARGAGPLAARPPGRRCTAAGRCWWTRTCSRIGLSAPVARAPGFPAGADAEHRHRLHRAAERAAAVLVAAQRPALVQPARLVELPGRHRGRRPRGRGRGADRAVPPARRQPGGRARLQRAPGRGGAAPGPRHCSCACCAPTWRRCGPAGAAVPANRARRRRRGRAGRAAPGPARSGGCAALRRSACCGRRWRKPWLFRWWFLIG